MGCGGSRRFLPILLFAAAADGLWTAADVDRVVCNALRNSNASGGCPPAPPAPSVPVIVLDDKHVISNGAPEKDFLRRTFKHLIDTGTVPPHLGA